MLAHCQRVLAERRNAQTQLCLLLWSCMPCNLHKTCCVSTSHLFFFLVFWGEAKAFVVQAGQKQKQEEVERMQSCTSALGCGGCIGLSSGIVVSTIMLLQLWFCCWWRWTRRLGARGCKHARVKHACHIVFLLILSRGVCVCVCVCECVSVCVLYFSLLVLLSWRYRRCCHSGETPLSHETWFSQTTLRCKALNNPRTYLCVHRAFPFKLLELLRKPNASILSGKPQSGRCAVSLSTFFREESLTVLWSSKVP